ncbi:hypothetical protein N1851_031016 [Merluccius polli]|uniref:Uncharacterized protein n=1 Tax=Merluccius polli TaxID=89951 RepID=A0AA47NPM8_MERPO|nr:hypothetical protein N1851_031016 [Merluccius polli]
MEGHEVTWMWLQEKGQIPGDEEQDKLLPYLAEAERTVLRELERHKAEEGKQSWRTKKKWRAALEEKEERRASVHTIALACVALEAQKDKNLPRTVTKTVTVTASPTGPTAPTYTQMVLKSLCAHTASDNTADMRTPPPYTAISQGGIQAPVINRYCFTSQSIIYIHNLIRPYMCNITNRSHALTSQQILCVALRFFCLAQN